MVTYRDGFLPLRCHMTLWSSGRGRTHDKLKSLYLCYHNPYGLQTWEDGDLPWEASTRKVTCPFDYVVLRDYMTNYNHLTWEDADLP